MEVGKKRFIGVDFMGDVRNSDKFIRALGGYDQINQTFRNSTSRLAVNLHPDTNFIRGSYLTPTAANVLVMKVKVRRTSDTVPEVVSSRVEGIVDKVYQCKGLVGFQYLPARRVDSTLDIHEYCTDEQRKVSEYEDMSSAVLFSGVPREGVDWMLKPKHSFNFVVPTIYSRVDVPMQYYLRHITARVKRDLGDELIAGHRDRPRHLTHHINFTDPVPTEMLPNASERFKYFNQSARNVHDKLIELFEERPIWNRAALHYKLFEALGVDSLSNQLKFVLPTLSYLSVTTPWKAMHIRLGYDPKLHPESKKYQTIEFRLKPRWHNDRVMQMVGCKRSPWVRSTPGSKIFSGRPVSGGSSTDKQTEIALKAKMWKRAFLYEKGELPCQLMSYYQLCDVNLAEVQELVHENDGKESDCSATSGWLPPKMITDIRAIMTFDCETTIFGEEEAKSRKEARIKRALAAERQVALSDGGVMDESTADQAADDEEDADEVANDFVRIMNSDSSDEEDEDFVEHTTALDATLDDDHIATAQELMAAATTHDAQTLPLDMPGPIPKD